jgi:hypothetical protein
LFMNLSLSEAAERPNVIKKRLNVQKFIPPSL